MQFLKMQIKQTIHFFSRGKMCDFIHIIKSLDFRKRNFKFCHAKEMEKAKGKRKISNTHYKCLDKLGILAGPNARLQLNATLSA
jgi:hypothetical protein